MKTKLIKINHIGHFKNIIPAILIPALLIILTTGCSYRARQYKEPLRSAQIDSVIDLAARSNHVWVRLLTKSYQGKNVWIVGNQKQPAENNLKILIFAQQHGNEPSGKEAVVQLITEIANNKWDKLLKGIDLYLIPCMNPDGAEIDQRRNGQGIDQNRDHLLRESVEVYALHKFFDSIDPHITVDIHEYYPYDSVCIQYGFIKQFDIQFGCLTNTNIHKSILDYSHQQVKPFIQDYVTRHGYSFFEYTVGSLAYGDRLRHSTVDINDGRQSFGIRPGLSFIVEGIAGQKPGDKLPARSKAQFITLKALLEYAALHRDEIINLIENMRKTPVANPGCIGLRLDHYKNGIPLQYPLYNIKTGNDSVFIVNEYYPAIKTDLNVSAPKGYLIPKSDTLLVNFVYRYGFEVSDFTGGDAVMYQIDSVAAAEVEECPSQMPYVTKKVKNIQNHNNYIFLKTGQPKSLALVLAFEPQSSVGLVQYKKFDYLLKQKNYPVYRVE